MGLLQGGHIETAGRTVRSHWVRRGAMGVVGALVASMVAMLVGVPSASATPWLTFNRNIQTRPFTGTSTSMGDNEGMAYVATNDTLWVVDDVPGRLYAVNRTTGVLGQVFTNAQFQAATILGGTEVAGTNRVKDIEAVAYDSVTDTMYVFSGTCCTVAALPTVFRFSRPNTSSAFVLDSWQPLAAPYNDLSGAEFRNGELWAATGKTIVKYDYVTNTASSPVTLTGAPSAIYSLAFNASGSEMWVVGSSAKVIKYDWASKTPVSGYSFTMYSFGVNDPRAIEIIGSQMFLSDGYDYYPAGSTTAFAIRVFDMVDVTVTAPVASFTATPTSGNSPLTVAFADTSTNIPTSWSWSFGDGTTSTAHKPSKIYSTPGLYSVTMTATNPGGSSTSAATTINVGNVPVASFTKSVSTGAVPLSVTFTSTSTNSPTNWSWSFGDGTPVATTAVATHIFQDPGVYNVTLTATNASGSGTSSAQQVTVTSVGGDLTTTFGASDDASVDQIVTTPKPTATTLYNLVSATAAKRSYLKFNVTSLSGPVTNAKLRVWVTDGTDNGARWYLLNTNAWSQTTLTYANAPAVAGTVVGDPAAVPVSAWLEFDVTAAVTGNGTFSFVNQPQSTNQERYSSREGTVPPQLVITTNAGGGSVPSASFTKSAATGVAPLNVTFADTSTNAPTSWSWNFGDGTPASTTQNPAHSFAAVGVYNVTLTATNAAGSNTSLAQSVTVNAPPAAPIASFTKSASSGAAPLTVNFTDTSTNTPTGWSWNFGDGSPASIDQLPTHTYTAGGTYNVTLTATNAVGSNTSAAQTVTVTAAPPVAPVASFTKSAVSGGAPLSVTFTDTSTNTPTSWSWDFGDGTPVSALQNPVHGFTAAGSYSVVLTATNAAGSNASAAQTVTVTAAPPVAPVASFTKSAVSGGAPLSVTFTDTSTNTPSSWSWNFGDGTPVSTLQSPVHGFMAAGSYSVVLTATNAAGSNASAAQVVTVTAGGGPVTTTFVAAEDSYVDLAVPTTAKGTSGTLYNVQSTNTQRSYIKFNVTGVSGTVTNAKLRLWVTDGTDNGAAWYKISDNTWAQATLTWANAPAVTGSLVGDPTTVTVGTWLEIPVTAFITGNGTVSFANLPTSTNAEKYSSKEGVNAPQLVITTG